MTASLHLSATPVLAGLAAGLAGMIMIGRALRRLLYGIAPADPGREA